jgi:hypothetical protein
MTAAPDTERPYSERALAALSGDFPTVPELLRAAVELLAEHDGDLDAAGGADAWNVLEATEYALSPQALAALAASVATACQHRACAEQSLRTCWSWRWR